MNRSDVYGCSSYRRNVYGAERGRFSSLKRYAIIIPIAIANSFFPSTIDKLSAKIPDREISFVAPRKQSLEEKLDKIFDGDVSKHNLGYHVKSKVNELLETEGSRKELEKTLSKISKYEDYIEQASKETGLDMNFIKAYIAQESRGKQTAKSKKGASGLGGMRKSAAKEVKLRIDSYVDERFSPKTIFGSATYMKEKCIDRFNDHILGMLAYNAGPTWTSKNLSLILNGTHLIGNKNLPAQSRDYVVQVLAKTQIFSNPEFYNLNVERKRPLSSTTREHLTKRNTNIKELAKVYRVRVEKIKMANPSIKRYEIPKDIRVYIPRS